VTCEASASLSTLKTVFPTLELAVLQDLLDKNEHDLERAASAASALANLTADVGPPPNQPAPQPPSNTPRPPSNSPPPSSATAHDQDDAASDASTHEASNSQEYEAPSEIADWWSKLFKPTTMEPPTTSPPPPLKALAPTMDTPMLQPIDEPLLSRIDLMMHSAAIISEHEQLLRSQDDDDEEDENEDDLDVHSEFYVNRRPVTLI